MNHLKILAIVALYLTLSLPIVQAEDKSVNGVRYIPQILVTIKPVHSLVSALLDGVSRPELLLDGRYSPHTYHLKPSDMQQLTQANIIIWAGSALETRLEKTIHRQRQRAKIITLLTSSHQGQSNGHTTPDHETDPHQWLDPQQVIKLTEHLRHELISMLPMYSNKINHNAKKLTYRLEQLDQQIASQFIGRKKVSAILYHDAWHYFKKRYGLVTDGIVSGHEQQQPGTRHLYHLQQTIKTEDTQCLLIQPQLKPRYLNILNKDDQLIILSADPLGAAIEPGPDAYFILMRNISRTFQQCLKN